MPELPDVTVYVEALRRYAEGESLEGIRLQSAFVLRSVDPPLASVHGATVRSISRIGKRIVIELDRAHFLVIHLMIAGRLRWRPRAQSIPKGNGLAAFDFATGTLLFTEAGRKKRASLHLVWGREALQDFDRGGLEILHADVDRFREALTDRNHTLKRALTDPGVFSGVGNAYSDEILHAAELSPFKQSQSLSGEEVERLYHACVETLRTWTARLRAEVGEGFPDKVTAFRTEMAVHGRYRQPCPRCGDPVQRIVYARNEANYCATCQTGGRLLADRALSRLLKANWPKTLEELEERS